MIETMNNQVNVKITKAKMSFMLDHPFYASLIMRMPLIENLNEETACTDGNSIEYNPSFIEGLSIKETEGLIAHELLHAAMFHHLRRGNRNFEAWNEACDYAINLIITDSCYTDKSGKTHGMEIPQGGLLNENYRDMSAEQIYSTFTINPDGSFTTPDGREGGREGNNPGMWGKVKDLKGGNATEKEKTDSLENWTLAVTQAAYQAQKAGKCPAGIDRLVRKMLYPRVDWRTALQRFVSETAKNDYSWSRFNRRYIDQEMFTPSLRSSELGAIGVGCDTSGSISDKKIDEFAAEMSGILDIYNTGMKVMYFDSIIENVQDFESEDLPIDSLLRPKGGGGTDFRPVFRYIEEEGYEPACLVMLTDGYCDSFPSLEPEYPVLWIVFGNTKFDPPFGEVAIFE